MEAIICLTLFAFLWLTFLTRRVRELRNQNKALKDNQKDYIKEISKLKYKLNGKESKTETDEES